MQNTSRSKLNKAVISSSKTTCVDDSGDTIGDEYKLYPSRKSGIVVIGRKFKKLKRIKYT